MRRLAALLLPAAWLLLTAETATPPVATPIAPPITTPSSSTPPSTTPSPTPAPTPTPTPRTGYLSLDPTLGPPGTRVTVSGSQFLPNQQVQVYFDTTDKVFATPTADAAGAFKVDFQIPDTAAVGAHTVCSPQATVNTPCANLRVEAKPSPTPSDSPSPTPSSSPTALPSAAPTDLAASPAAGRLDSISVLMRPPFVFFPILLVLAAIGAVAWIWLGGRRPPRPVRSAVVRHTSVTPPPSALPTQPPPPPAPSTAAAAREDPLPEPPPPRAAPGDESIDMPLPGD